VITENNCVSLYYYEAHPTPLTLIVYQDIGVYVTEVIKSAFAEDPRFEKCLLTGNRCLEAIEEFLSQGGNPAFCIPELDIGTERISNIFLLEFVYCLHQNLFDGLDVDWDEEGVQINRRFENILTNGLEKIDELLLNELTIEESVNIIQSVLGSDPKLFRQEKTVYRLLNAFEKFYKAGGDPLYSFSGKKVGSRKLTDCSLFEQLHILSHLPLGYGFMRENWEYEEDHCSIKSRFITLIHDFKIKISERFLGKKTEDKDYLPMIRCTLEFFNDSLISDYFSKKSGENFLWVMEHFVKNKVDPNLTFSQLEIDGNIYTDIACYQVVYLVWKHPVNRELSDKFSSIFDKLLIDYRLDLTHPFSEFELATHHFVSQNHNQNQTNPHLFNLAHGYSLEFTTIAHHCVMLNDYPTLIKILKLSRDHCVYPNLLDMTCSITKGKGLLFRIDGERYKISSSSLESLADVALEKDDQLSGELKISNIFSTSSNELEGKVYRITKVSLLHLAARLGFEGVIGCLIKHSYQLAVVDSDDNTPQDYLRLSLTQRSISNVSQSENMLRALQPNSFSPKSKVHPKVHQIIIREGYYLHYNTSRKVANFVCEHLGLNSFGNAIRAGHTWVDNLDIPGINRASNKDYINSGYDRGHLVPARDATYSEERMKETFHPENAVPQNLNLNRGAWKRLEAHVHKLALIKGNYLQVFTGPIFVPTQEQSGRRISYPVIGGGDIHVPTHLFKIIYIFTKEVRCEVFILPNEEIPKLKTFSNYKCADFKEGIRWIQKYTGLIFDQCLKDHQVQNF